jgi:hypothetical protein
MKRGSISALVDCWANNENSHTLSSVFQRGLRGLCSYGGSAASLTFKGALS